MRRVSGEEAKTQQAVGVVKETRKIVSTEPQSRAPEQEFKRFWRLHSAAAVFSQSIKVISEFVSASILLNRLQSDRLISLDMIKFIFAALAWRR